MVHCFIDITLVMCRLEQVRTGAAQVEGGVHGLVSYEKKSFWDFKISSIHWFLLLVAPLGISNIQKSNDVDLFCLGLKNGQYDGSLQGFFLVAESICLPSWDLQLGGLFICNLSLSYFLLIMSWRINKWWRSTKRIIHGLMI